MHIPVLLKEVTTLLDPKPGEFFIDGTVGGGGHALAILEKIAPAGKFLAIDWDNDVFDRFREKIARISNFQLPISNIVLVNGNYANLTEILKKYKLPKADGLFLDLGMSSDQLEHSGRGFSFLRDEPLIMKYHYDSDYDDSDLTAAEVVNGFSEKELAHIFWKYGEERYARRIAKNIVEIRKKKPILTTFDLVHTVISHRHRYRIHPATRIFQALRIYVNRELENLETLLQNIPSILEPHGRAAIISFHSLEDRLVKSYFKKISQNKMAVLLTKKPIVPTQAEVKANPRSRSAKLRALKINE